MNKTKSRYADAIAAVCAIPLNTRDEGEYSQLKAAREELNAARIAYEGARQ